MNGTRRQERTVDLAAVELDALLRALPDIYFRLDAEGRIASWHAGSEAELHVPPEEFIGRKPGDVLPPEVAPLIAAAVERARAERALVTVEYTLATPSGDDEFEARLVACGETEVTAIIRNTTARRRAEAALLASEERLRASQKMDAIGRLAGGVAHDFNNLLTVILGRLQFLERAADLPAEDREHVTEALDATVRAVSLTRQLMALGRRPATQPLVFDLNAVIEPMHEILRRIVGEHIDVTLLLNESAALISSDKTQIEQVILNLVLNARDAMPDGGTVVVSTRDVSLDEEQARSRHGAGAGTYVVLGVKDSGSGMTQDVLDHLFEPFFTTKSQGEGTGLGLATAYAIVKQSGGHAVVRSQIGVGSTFELFFRRAGQVDGAREVTPAPPPTQTVTGATETILVVEDEDGLRRLVVDILRRAGYGVVEAANGEDALRTLREGGPRVELLLTDVVMPKLNGRRLAARLAELRPETRVLLMSGHDDVKSPRGGGATEGGPTMPLLEKPFTQQTLLCRVREVLASARNVSVAHTHRTGAI